MKYSKKLDAYSKFQSVILSVAHEKLNLMLMEVCQLKEKIDFNDKKKLICTVLQKISNKEITSGHVTSDEAVKFLKLFDDCNKRKKVQTRSFKTKNTNTKSVFHDSPFS